MQPIGFFKRLLNRAVCHTVQYRHGGGFTGAANAACAALEISAARHLQFGGFLMIHYYRIIILVRKYTVLAV